MNGIELINTLIARLRISLLKPLPVKAFIALLAVSPFSISGAGYSTEQELVSRPELSAAQVNKILPHGPWPAAIPADPGNELSGQMWAERLGAKLFSDTTLSGRSNLSCASCHDSKKGFADGIALAIGNRQHVRNTQGLLNIGMQHWFGWDGGADSLWAASLRPMLSDIEMNGDIPTIATRLRNNPTITEAISTNFIEKSVDAIADEELVVLAAKSLAAYTRTLVSPPTAFDQFRNALASNNLEAQKDYPAAALRGLKIFIGDANCQVCHFGANFSNGEFHDIGRPFFTGVGQVDPGRYSGIKRLQEDRYNLTGSFNGTAIDSEIRKTLRVKTGQSNFGQWRTPSLRNLTLTAPYMHDGSVQTLRDVVDFYADIDPTRLHAKGESILKPLDLSNEDRNDLVIFLQTLTAN